MKLNPLARWFIRSTANPNRDNAPEIGELALADEGEELREGGIGTAIPDTWKIVYTETESGTKASVVSFDGSRIPISNRTALTLSAVYSCIDRISSAVATTPMYICQEIDGEEKPVRKHPAKFLLEKSPNDWQTPFSLKRQFMVDVLGGNGYIWIKRNVNHTKFIEFEYCTESAVDLVHLSNGRWVYNYINENGQLFTIQPYDMIHVRALGNNSRRGLSPIKLHASTISMGLQMQAYGESFFGSGAKPSGVVGVKGSLDPKAWDKLIDNWNKGARQAASSQNRVIFQPADVTYTPISISPIDAQLIQAMKLTKDDVCGIFNVPAWMVGNIENASYSNITAMATGFVKNTLMPHFVNICEEFEKKIFFEDELEAGYKIKFDYAYLLRGTVAEMLAYYSNASKAGFITRNEGRVGIGYEKDTTDETMNKFTVNVSQSKLTNENGEDLTDENKDTGKDADGNEKEPK